MKLLYLSNACPEEEFQRIFTGARKPSQAAQKYHMLQIEGLQAQGQELLPLCVPPISRRTYKGLFFRRKHTEHSFRYVPMVNIPLLRNAWVFLYEVGS